MKLRVLALGFDGTITAGRRLHDGVAAAIREARHVGVMTVLVSGRMLTDIQAMLPAPDLFDAIVAESGGVVQMPDGANPAVLARGPDPALVAELHRRKVAYRSGLCMVEVEAGAAAEVLGALHALASPHGISFERGRLTVLPLGVSKATGLREAVRRLGTSLHNAVAIGGGDDDAPLLDACNLGAAVAWGSSSLQRSADHVVSGTGPADVARYVGTHLATKTIPRGGIPHSLLRLRLGTRDDGEPIDADDRGRNVLVAGDPRSGKTWFVGLLCEQLILNRYALCIVDPEGDYTCLEALPGVIVHRVRQGENPFPDHLERILRQPALSVILELSGLAIDAKRAAVRSLLGGVDAVRRTVGVPHRVVLDEAHYFLHSSEDAELFDPDLGGYCLVTYRIPDLAPRVLDACDGVIVTRIADRRAAARVLGLARPAASAQWLETIASLQIGEAVLLPTLAEQEHAITRFKFARRSTKHVRHRQKYVDVGVPAGREFVFTRDGRPTEYRVRTVRELLEAVPAVPDDVFAGHLRRGDFHRWIDDVVADRALADAIRRIEGGNGTTVRQTFVQAIRDRYLEGDSETRDGRPTDQPFAAPVVTTESRNDDD